MRTNIDSPDELLAAAMAATGLKSKRATVEEALRQLVQVHERRRAIDDMAGLGWEGDLKEMRHDRAFPEALCSSSTARFGSTTCATRGPMVS